MTDLFLDAPVAAIAVTEHDLSFYDALYVALAARLRLPLITADVRLGNAPKLPCSVEIIR